MGWESLFVSTVSGALPWLLGGIIVCAFWVIQRHYSQKKADSDQDNLIKNLENRADKIEDRLDAIESYDASITDRLHKLELEILQRLTSIETALEHIRNGH